MMIILGEGCQSAHQYPPRSAQGKANNDISRFTYFHNVFKKGDDKCFIDLVTSRRVYCLCADTRAQAAEWQERIQNCL